MFVFDPLVCMCMQRLSASRRACPAGSSSWTRTWASRAPASTTSWLRLRRAG